MSFVKLTGISKDFKSSFGKIQSRALFDINLDIEEGEIVCLLGPSGSGKTTLLRIIAGIEAETSGTIELNGTAINKLNAQKREIGFVFQNIDAVYPHLTVFENIAFPLSLSLRKQSKKEAEGQVNSILQKVNLITKRDRYPSELSGGEKQRIALARALVYQPKLLLLDEPLSSLDNILKKEILDLIKTLHAQLNTTILYVTHDEREAIDVADRIVVLAEGRLLQQGTYQEITENPRNSKVAKINGGWNVISGQYFTQEKFYLKINDRNYDWKEEGLSEGKEIEIGIPISQTQLLRNNASDGEDDCLYIPCVIGKIVNYQNQVIIDAIVGNERLRIENTAAVLNHFSKNETALLKVKKSFIRLWK